MSATLKRLSDGLPVPLKLHVDAGTAWSCPTGSEGCFNVTYGGVTKSVADHVVDLSDEVLLMDYDRNTSSLYQRAKPYLDCADQIGKEKSISVGVAVASQSESPQSWQTHSEEEMESMMADANPLLHKHASFKQYQVFTDGEWESWNSTKGPVTFSPAGTWYMDHAAVLNATLRQEWLDWAKARAVTAVHIALHAGNLDLLGTAQSSEQFCEFVKQADSCCDIDITLYGVPTQDIAWIRACSKNMTSTL